MEIIEGGNPQNKKKAKIGAIVYGVAVIAILLLPFVTYPDPPPGQEGVVVNLGIPDAGQGDENAPKSEKAAKPVEPTEQPKPPKPEKPVEKPVKKPQKTKPTKTKPAKKKIITNDDSKQRAIESAKKKQAAEAAKKIADAKRAAQAEANRIKAAKAAAAKAAAAEKARLAAEAEKTKSGIGNLFNGSGKGKTGKPGNQGDPNGDPNASKLTGISGAGQVGGGLQGRGGSGPQIKDNSQKTGRVVIRVKVDANGRVISAKYTQRGSNTTDPTLIRLAERNAKQWKFKKGAIDEQTGTITYVFKVK